MRALLRSGARTRFAGARPTAPVHILASQWAFATGNSAPAINDGGRWNGTTGGASSTSGVETLASLGLTAPAELAAVANAFVTRAEGTAYSDTVSTDYDAGNPVAGTTRFIRWYNAQIQPDATGDGSISNIEHGIESVETGGGDGWNFMRIPRSDGTWRLIFRDINSGLRFAAWDVPLPKHIFIRIEAALAYGESTYTVQPRVYNAAGSLVLTAANFTQSVGPDLGDPLTGYAMAYAAAEHRFIRVGNNGPTTNYPGVGGVGSPPSNGDGMNAVTAFAYGTTGWRGPYVEGNG